MGKECKQRGTRTGAVRTLPTCERVTTNFCDRKCEEASSEANVVNTRRIEEEDGYRPG